MLGDADDTDVHGGADNDVLACSRGSSESHARPMRRAPVSCALHCRRAYEVMPLTPPQRFALRRLTPDSADLARLDEVIAHMEGTAEEAWGVGVVRTMNVDGTQLDCFFGHLFSMAPDDRGGNEMWEWFEGTWSSTYGIYPVNDGKNPAYQQPTPKQRVIAFLRELRSGEEPTTSQWMELNYRGVFKITAVSPWATSHRA